ncbi:MAG: lipoyl(octanoyl) transferase LipB [Pseudomonadota bacterium]
MQKYIGKIDYDSAVKLQLGERERVKKGESSGTVFFLEHQPAVITLGRNAVENNVLLPEKLLASRGYQVRKVSRGGDVTVHEPGQLVVYFVLPLKAKNVKNFVDAVMNTVQECLLTHYSLKTDFDEKKPGLWVGDKKICSVGFDLTQRVSMHGIALNVCNLLEGFSMIVPCGLSGVEMTTISKELNKPVTVDDVANKLMFGYHKSLGA